MPFRNSIPIKSFPRKCALILLHFTLWCRLVLSPNGVLILPLVNPLLPLVIITLLWLLITLPKWVEVIPTYANGTKTTALFMFNHIIAKFDVPLSLVMDHGSHFCNTMMTELATLLHFDQENSSPYYPQANGQVESTNHVLKTMLQRMVGKYKSNWHL